MSGLLGDEREQSSASDRLNRPRSQPIGSFYSSGGSLYLILLDKRLTSSLTLPHSGLFSSDSSSPLLTRIVQGLLGTLGVYALIRFLPRLVSSFFKRFVFGVIGEILLVAVGTLLTERLTRSSSQRHASEQRSGVMSTDPAPEPLHSSETATHR